MNRYPQIVCVLLIWTLGGCAAFAPSATEPPLVLVTVDPNATATPTPFQPGPTAAAPSSTETSPPTDIPSPTATFTAVPPTRRAARSPTIAASAAPTQPMQAGARTQYTLTVTLDYGNKGLAVNETIRYANNTGEPLANVVLAVEPDLYPNCFTLASISQDGNAVTNYTLDGQRLTIDQAAAIQPGAMTTFALGYSLALPAKPYQKTFGYASHQLNLTDWYPFIVPYAGGWVLHEPSSFGEYLEYDAADYDVSVAVNDPDVVLAASAPAEVMGSATTHYHVEAARTFSISASDSFKVDQSAVGPVKILAYYFAGHEAANQSVVWMATQSLSLYQAKFGLYPHESLSIVETDMSDGQEYDGLVFLASRFYTEYGGSARSNLFDIGTHEIAHQWWFGLVGNDQATEPWLDEALAVYSERIFYQYNYPSYGDWWWTFRVNSFGPHGYVDSDVYGFSTFSAYVEAVYLNGAEFLEDLRTRVGDEVFFAFLQDYAARYAHGHASSADFFAVLRLHTKKDLSDIVQTYFQREY